MKVIDVKQGTPEWLAARMGIPTASQFHRILTPKTYKESTQVEKYLLTLLCERILGHPVQDDEYEDGFTIRGTKTEGDAVTAYELARDCDTQVAGFVMHDSGLYGCSPDRLVGDDGGLEIKCLSAQNHIAALLGKVDPKHLMQVQGSLYVTGRKWWDLLFYNPAFPYVIRRIKPDDEVQAALGVAVNALCVRLAEGEKKYRAEYMDTVAKMDEAEKPAKKAKPAKAEKPEPWDETPVNTRTAAETKAAAPKPEPVKGPSDPDPKREFFGVLKNWTGSDGEAVVSTKSAANMRLLVSGLLSRNVTSDAMTEEDWQKALDEFISCMGVLDEKSWKQWCEARIKGVAKKEVKKVEKEQDISLDDFEPVSTSKAMTVDGLVKLANRAREHFGFDEATNGGRVFYGERAGKKLWVDKRTLVAAELPLQVTDLSTLDATQLQALYDAVSEEMK